MRKVGIYLLASFLLVALAPVSMAQTSSKDFPNDKVGNTVNVSPAPTGGGIMHVNLKVRKQAAVNSGPLILTSPTGIAGKDVATLPSNALCSNALLPIKGYTCTGTVGIAPCAGPACCAALTTDNQFITCTIGGAGFALTRFANDFKFTCAPAGTGVLDGLQSQTNAGNTVADDVLDWYLVRVAPNGNDGVVNFDVRVQSSPTTSHPFAVTTTGKSDQVIHEEIAAGFNGLGLGLKAKVHRRKDLWQTAPEGVDPWFIRFKTRENDPAGPVVRVLAGGPKGMEIYAENNKETSKEEVPALSSWGIVLLTLILLVTGIWMVQRRLGREQRA